MSNTNPVPISVDADSAELHPDAHFTLLELVENLRCLYILDPEGHRAPLASSLHNLEYSFYCLNCWEDARISATESIDLERILYAMDPAVHHAALSSSLHNLGIYLDKLRLWEDARVAVTELIDLQRVLYMVDPEAYRADLADSLDDLSFCLAKLKLWDDAQAAAVESMQLRQQLYTTDPDAYHADLINSLFEFGRILHAIERSIDVYPLTSNVATIPQLPLDTQGHHRDNASRLHLPVTALDSFVGHPRPLHNGQVTAFELDVNAVALLDITGKVRRSNNAHIGAGGYGTVYHAQALKPVFVLFQGNTEPDELIVKVLKGSGSGFSVSSESVISQRILREMIIWYRLLDPPHPNIVPFLGFITDLPDGLGLISPFFSNGDVMHYLSQNPLKDCTKICADIARGLRHLHTFSPVIIHGDLKPANVIIHTDGHAALCDFGLSYLCGSSEGSTAQHGSISSGFTASEYGGTLRYLAPEFLGPEPSNKPTFAADVYAFGCTVAEILTGREPFARIRAHSHIIDALCAGELPYNLTDITKHFSGFTFLGECWAGDPTARPSMVEVCGWMGILPDPE